MKQKTIVKTLGMAALIAALVGCAGVTNLTTFANEVSRQQETYDGLDGVPEDTGVTTIQPRRLAEGSDIELTNEEKIVLILAARQSIRADHETIMAIRATLSIDGPALRDQIAAFREAGLTLTDDERLWLADLVAELRQIRAEVKETIGLVWGPLHDLRDQYSIENIDLILQTYRTAAAAMEIRVSAIIRVDAIISEVMDFIAAKVG